MEFFKNIGKINYEGPNSKNILGKNVVDCNESGRQEYLESIINDILFK